MSNYSSYPQVDYTNDLKLLAGDPARSELVRVSGQSLFDYLNENLEQFTGNMLAFNTTSIAVNEDLEIGRIIYTAGNLTPNDGSGGPFLVVAAGEGDIPIFNGNELLRLPFGSLVGSDASGALVTADGVTTTVAEAFEARQVFVSTVAEGFSNLPVIEGQLVAASSWHEGKEDGGGEFTGRASASKSFHNGGTVISPTVPPVSSQPGGTLAERTANFIAGNGETDPAGFGVFVRVNQGDTDFAIFGADTTFDDNSPSIQAALDYVVTLGGGTVYRTEGTYSIQQPLFISSNTTMALNNVVILRNAGIDNMIRNKSAGVVGLYGASNNITLYGGTWDGNKDAFPTACTPIAFGHAARINLLNGAVTRYPVFHGVELNAVADATVNGWRFTDGTLTDNAEALQIDIMASSFQFPWFGPYDSTPCGRITITDSIFDNVGTGIGTHSSSMNMKHTGIVVDNCKFFNIEYSCIKALDWAGVKITNNRCDNARSGFLATASSGTVCADFVVSGNTFFNINKDASSRAVQINGATAADRRFIEVSVVDNFVRVVGNHGIGVDYADYVTISNNRVRACGGTGIWAYGCRKFTVSGNVAEGNDTDGSGRFDITIGGTPAVDTVHGAVTGNHMGKGYVGNVSLVLMRQNSILTSLFIGPTTSSSTNENLIAGTLS